MMEIHRIPGELDINKKYKSSTSQSWEVGLFLHSIFTTKFTTDLRYYLHILDY